MAFDNVPRVRSNSGHHHQRGESGSIQRQFLHHFSGVRQRLQTEHYVEASSKYLIFDRQSRKRAILHDERRGGENSKQVQQNERVSMPLF